MKPNKALGLVIIATVLAIGFKDKINLPSPSPSPAPSPSTPAGPTFASITALQGTPAAKAEAAAAFQALADVVKASPGVIKTNQQAKVLIDRWQKLLAPHVTQKGGIPGFAAAVASELKKALGAQPAKIDQSRFVEFLETVARSLK